MPTSLIREYKSCDKVTNTINGRFYQDVLLVKISSPSKFHVCTSRDLPGYLYNLDTEKVNRTVKIFLLWTNHSDHNTYTNLNTFKTVCFFVIYNNLIIKSPANNSLFQVHIVRGMTLLFGFRLNFEQAFTKGTPPF